MTRAALVASWLLLTFQCSVTQIGKETSENPRTLSRFHPVGFDHAELGVAIFQNIIRRERFAALAVALDTTECDGIFTPERLPATTPQPAAFNAGSICSALVSASFICVSSH
jgi:hypothetical protein